MGVIPRWRAARYGSTSQDRAPATDAEQQRPRDRPHSGPGRRRPTAIANLLIQAGACTTRVGLTARPSPALSIRDKVVTRSGSMRPAAREWDFEDAEEVRRRLPWVWARMT